MDSESNVNLETTENAEGGSKPSRDPELIIEKQRMIILGLGVLAAILLIGVVVQSLGKSYVMKQLDEANASILSVQKASGDVESRTDSLGQLNTTLQGELDTTKENLGRAEGQIAKLQDKVKKLEDANKMLRAKRGLPEEAAEDEDLAAEIAAADEASAAAAKAKAEAEALAEPEVDLADAAAKAEKDAMEDQKSREAYEEQRAAEEAIRKKNALKNGEPYVPLTDEEYEEYLESQGAEPKKKSTSRIYRFTDKNGDTADFTETEWKYLLSVWENTGEAEEYLKAHTIGELRQVLGGM